jgi:hypothetical protein
VFKPVGVEQLLELPLHVMDTAMFYPPYMNLSDGEARSAMLPMIEHANKSGGVLTINWHDRSIAPERLWGEAYKTLLDDLRARKAWFATGAKAVSWFRQRRTAAFGAVVSDAGAMRISVSSARSGPDLPPLKLRVYNRRALDSTGEDRTIGAFEEFSLDESDQVLVAA